MFKSLTFLLLTLFALYANSTLIKIETNFEMSQCTSTDLITVVDCGTEYTFNTSLNSSILIDIDDSVINFDYSEDDTFDPIQTSNTRYVSLINSVNIFLDEVNLNITSTHNNINIQEVIHDPSFFSNRYSIFATNGNQDDELLFSVNLDGFLSDTIERGSPFLNFEF